MQSEAGAIALLKMTLDDVALCYEHQQDPEAGHMAAFVSKDRGDKAAYMARWEKLLSSGDVLARMISLDGVIVGSIGSWGPREERQVTYWIWKQHWGKGIATAALTAFLKIEKIRPLYGCAAQDNHGSLRVLEKCGFRLVRRERGFAIARGKEIDEAVLKLG